MPDQYEGISVPNPERANLFRSVFHLSPLEEVAEAITVATEMFHEIYVERRGDQWRWSLATKGGPYPLLRISAKFLQMDYFLLAGIGSRVVGDGWCVQIVDDFGNESDGWSVLTFDGAATVQQVTETLTQETH